LDIFDLVAEDGKIVSSAEWPARFGYTLAWATSRAPATPFLQVVELPHETTLALVTVRRVNAGSRALLVAGGRRLGHALLAGLALQNGVRGGLYRNIQPEIPRKQLIAASQAPVPDAARFEPLIARVRQYGLETAERIEWTDGPETVDGIPLAGPSGNVLGVL